MPRSKRADLAAERLYRRRSDDIAIPMSLKIASPIVAALDLITVVALGVAAGMVYDSVALEGKAGAADYLTSAMVVASIFSTLGHAGELYQHSNLLEFGWQVRRSCLIWSLSFTSLAIVVFLMKIGSEFSRGWIILYFVSGIAAIGMTRFFIARFCSMAISSHLFRPNKVVLVGLAEEIAENESIFDLDRLGYVVMGVFPVDIERDRLPTEADLTTRVREIVSLIRDMRVDEVIVAIPWRLPDVIQVVEHELSLLPIPLKLVPDKRTSGLLDHPMCAFGATRAIQLQRAPLSPAEESVKRALDQCFAAIGLILLIPLFAIIALAIRVESPGRAMFLQSRAGFNGKPFKIIKFRTMTAWDDGPVVVQATRNDKRTTRLGALLRKLSIDELPQLLNVLRGEMSLVGPRPHAIAHDNEYDKLIATYAMRHKMKPGITGWAQVNGFRGETPELGMMKQRVQSDLWYIDSWSLWLDICILFMTVIRLAKSPKAY
jgi:Undecaprenyl-phosphate glucose phosphotransferase